MKSALLLIDIQNDFCPGGALAVNEGDKIVSVVNELQKKFDTIIATQDWHPQDHKSFAANHEGKNIGEIIKLGDTDQILWPVHCTQNSFGAEFVKDLNTEKLTKVFQKGMNKEVDSYSGFFDNDHKSETGLNDYLKQNVIEELFITGLATDYCVKFTAKDALSLGYKVNLVLDACRGVNLSDGDVDKAVEEMKNAGANIINSNEI